MDDGKMKILIFLLLAAVCINYILLLLLDREVALLRKEVARKGSLSSQKESAGKNSQPLREKTDGKERKRNPGRIPKFAWLQDRRQRNVNGKKAGKRLKLPDSADRNSQTDFLTDEDLLPDAGRKNDLTDYSYKDVKGKSIQAGYMTDKETDDRKTTSVPRQGSLTTDVLKSERKTSDKNRAGSKSGVSDLPGTGIMIRTPVNRASGPRVPVFNRYCEPEECNPRHVLTGTPIRMNVNLSESDHSLCTYALTGEVSLNPEYTDREVDISILRRIGLEVVFNGTEDVPVRKKVMLYMKEYALLDTEEGILQGKGEVGYYE